MANTFSNIIMIIDVNVNILSEMSRIDSLIYERNVGATWQCKYDLIILSYYHRGPPDNYQINGK
jgi:hypothetical protein